VGQPDHGTVPADVQVSPNASGILHRLGQARPVAKAGVKPRAQAVREV